jgi:high-affinity K+ transport system ATPase subunit B
MSILYIEFFALRDIKYRIHSKEIQKFVAKSNPKVRTKPAVLFITAVGYLIDVIYLRGYFDDTYGTPKIDCS